MAAIYDSIGSGYHRFRQPDARIAVPILRALGDARSVVNVGAGCGSYEPGDRYVVAVEPSMTMIRQRPSSAAPVIQASAHDLPLHDDACDAALAVLTLHHWPDWRRGVWEMIRVARRRVVILTWDPDAEAFWLTDYFPEILDLDRPNFPTLDELRRELGAIAIHTIPVPHDCRDGFLGAYWRRPEAYLDAGARGAISTFAKLDDVLARLERLRDDLASGAWAHRHGELRAYDALDLGYRLVVAPA